MLLSIRRVISGCRYVNNIQISTVNIINLQPRQKNHSQSWKKLRLKSINKSYFSEATANTFHQLWPEYWQNLKREKVTVWIKYEFFYDLFNIATVYELAPLGSSYAFLSSMCYYFFLSVTPDAPCVCRKTSREEREAGTQTHTDKNRRAGRGCSQYRRYMNKVTRQTPAHYDSTGPSIKCWDSVLYFLFYPQRE